VLSILQRLSRSSGRFTIDVVGGTDAQALSQLKGRVLASSVAKTSQNSLTFSRRAKDAVQEKTLFIDRLPLKTPRGAALFVPSRIVTRVEGSAMTLRSLAIAYIDDALALEVREQHGGEFLRAVVRTIKAAA
jgi:hypothetical protein